MRLSLLVIALLCAAIVRCQAPQPDPQMICHIPQPSSQCLAVSGTGLFALPMGFATIGVYRIADGTLVTSLTGGPAQPNSLAFSPDGVYLAAWTLSSADPAPLRFWKVADPNPQAQQAPGTGVTRLVFSPDSRYVATWNKDKNLQVWQTADWTKVGEAAFFNSPTFSFTPDSTALLVTSADKGFVQRWAFTKDAAPVVTAVPMPKSYYLTLFSADAGTLLALDAKGTIVCRDLPAAGTVAPPRTWTCPTSDQVEALSPDGKLLITARINVALDFVDTTTGTVTHSVDLKALSLRGNATSTFTPDGHSLLVACASSVVMFPVPETVAPPTTPKTLLTWTRKTGVYFSPTADLVAISTDQGDLNFLRASDLTPVDTLPRDGTKSNAFKGFSTDGQAFATWNGSKIDVWRADTLQNMGEVSSKDVQLLGISRTGENIVLKRRTATGESVIVMRTSDGAILYTRTSTDQGGITCNLSADGTALALVYAPKPGRPTVMEVVQLADGHAAVVASEGTDGVLELLSPSLSNDGVVVLAGADAWQVGDHAHLWTTTWGSEAPPVFSHDGTLVAEANALCINVLDMKSGQLRMQLKIGDPPTGRKVQEMKFSDDGTTFSAVLEGAGNLADFVSWHIKDGKPVETLNRPVARGVVFSPDGRYCVLQVVVQPIPTVFSTLTGKQLLKLPNNSLAAFSPDGTRCITVGNDGIATWRIPDPGP